MSDHAYLSARFHLVFSPKERQQLIKRHVQEHLWAYMAGIARNIGMKVFAISGADDHVHLLLGFPATLSVAEAVQKLKANSSRWMHESGHPHFMWQEGYAAFSVSISQSDATMRYIQNQMEHHSRHTFAEEWEQITRVLRE